MKTTGSATLLMAVAVLSVALNPVYAADETGLHGHGFRGDGSGVFPDATPPTHWSDTMNIRWKAPLPNWTYSSPTPLVDAQGKGYVFLMTEPFPPDYWPQLNCFNADTGAHMWKVPVNHLDAMPELSKAQRDEAFEQLKWVKDFYRTIYATCKPLLATQGAKADDPILIEVNKKLAEHGAQMEFYSPGLGLLRKVRLPDRFGKTCGELRNKFGITAITTWEGFGRARVGAAFPTPVSDGERVYVMTNHGTVACFDLSGKLLWSRDSGWNGNHGTLISPCLYGDLLLTGWTGTAQDPQVVAYAKTTGEVRWKVIAKGGEHGVKGAQSRTGGSMRVMTVGKTPVVLFSTGRVLRLPDGKLYEACIPESLATYVIDDDSDAVFSGGSHDGGSVGWCVELRMRDDDLVVTERWNGGKGANIGNTSGVLVNGQLFVPGSTIDWKTGVVKGGTVGFRANPRCSPLSNHVLLAGKGHVYGLEEKGPPRGSQEPYRGVTQVFDLEGRFVAENVLTAGPWNEAQTARLQEQGFNQTFSYACSMNIGGDRLFVLSQDYLHCIANDLDGRPQDDPQTLATIASSSSVANLAAHLASDSPAYRYRALLRLAQLQGKGAAVLEALRPSLDKLTADPYGEIRVAALRMLGLGAGKPGRESLWNAIIATWPKDQAYQPLAPVVHTLNLLGEDAIEPLVALMQSDRPPAERLAAAAACRSMGTRSASLRDKLIPLVDGGGPVQAVAVNVLTGIYGNDVDVLACLRRMTPATNLPPGYPDPVGMAAECFVARRPTDPADFAWMCKQVSIHHLPTLLSRCEPSNGVVDELVRQLTAQPDKAMRFASVLLLWGKAEDAALAAIRSEGKRDEWGKIHALGVGAQSKDVKLRGKVAGLCMELVAAADDRGKAALLDVLAMMPAEAAAHRQAIEAIAVSTEQAAAAAARKVLATVDTDAAAQRNQKK